MPKYEYEENRTSNKEYSFDYIYQQYFSFKCHAKVILEDCH